jgi:chloride channel protein, CIC family
MQISLRFLPQQTVAEAEAMLAGRVESGAPVLGERNNLLGVLTLADIQRVLPAERGQRRVAEAMNRDVLVISPDETLDEALEQLTSHRVSWAPVVDVEASPEGRHVVGLLSAGDIVRVYRETLAKSSRRMRGLVEGTVMLEVKIEPGMRLAGIPLRDAQLPLESLVVSIRRQGELLFPRGGVVIEPGDVVTFLVSPSGEERLQTYLAERVQKPEAALID